MELPTALDAAYTAHTIEDLGGRDIYDEEDGSDIESPHLVRLDPASTLSGHAPTEVLVTPFQLADATAEIAAGAELLVWLPHLSEQGYLFASLAALEPDGDAVFLGDCHPAWTPAFARYADRQPGDQTAAELLTRILVDPTGPEATAFRASDEAQTLAGPAASDPAPS